MPALETALENCRYAVEAELNALLPIPSGPENKLHEAMRYAALGGGKRLRSFMVLTSCEMFEGRRASALRIAAAVECVHSYSLIHDDLPCMDNDELRHGQPTLHIKFDEATAVLAGDALLTLSFEILSNPLTDRDSFVRGNLVLELTRAIGAHGMVAGQVIDLDAQNHQLDIGAITRLQQLKTGALIAYSCKCGAILGGGSRSDTHALHAYAHDLGLAYQITDDLLDHGGDASALGKNVGKDDGQGKATLIALMGADRARTQAEMLAEQAANHLSIFGQEADLLRDLAQFAITRSS